MKGFNNAGLFYEGVETTLRDYMKRHPPKKEKQREHER